MVEIKFDKMCDWERKKAIFLLKTAEDLGMNTSSYGELSVNENSGHTYLYLEDYDFCLYMPIDCELKINSIWALWINQDNGEEIEVNIDSNITLEDLNKWAELNRKGVSDD